MKTANHKPIAFLLMTLCVAITATSTAFADDPGRLLVSVDQLQAQLGDANLRIVDARPRAAYDAGHLPSAVHVDVSDWKSLGLSEGGLHDKAAWSERVGALGITKETPVVIYGGHPTSATRVWWTLKYLGVKQVAILDGGWDAWTKAKAPVTQDPPNVSAVEFTPDFQANRLAEMDDIQTVLKNKTATVIDTRSTSEYAGTRGPGRRKGHIPGAVHQEWSEFVAADGRFKPVAEIKSLLTKRGLSPDQTLITHCQTGGRASLNAFVMELAGYGPVKNYYCGWSQWSTTKDTPITQTSTP